MRSIVGVVALLALLCLLLAYQTTASEGSYFCFTISFVFAVYRRTIGPSVVCLSVCEGVVLSWGEETICLRSRRSVSFLPSFVGASVFSCTHCMCAL